MARPYQQTRRAQQREETRRRIVEAALELHEAVGPAQTTVSAIAERAGVQRLTVYTHFPEDRDLLFACTAHYQAANPPPDTKPWSRISDPVERLRVALTDIYAWCRDNEPMVANSVRDLPREPILAEVLAPMFEHWSLMQSVLAVGWGVRGMKRRRLLAALGHAIDFGTWHSLARRQGLDDSEAVEVMVGAVRAVVVDHGSSR
ncbi:MAG: TetR/AcrR family transcriptional regulator [Chloroflexia bacterium]|nr:TetR/AcrR family transcriptional regulator [Chloroflexia bacterium]